jgi:hypothetical protein
MVHFNVGTRKVREYHDTGKIYRGADEEEAAGLGWR